MKLRINSMMGAIVLSAAISGQCFASPWVWVAASGGSANNTCGAITTPCNNFQNAVNNVDSGGTVYVLGSGSFGQVSISKPVSIINEGAVASIYVSTTGGAGIFINTTGDVLLKGLVIDGSASAAGGISINSTGNVTISNCIIKNFVRTNGGGIAAYAGNVKILDALINHNIVGLLIDQTARVSISRSTLEDNVAGYTVGSAAIFKSYGDNIFVNNGNSSGTVLTATHN